MLTVKDAFHNYYDTPRLGTRAPAAAPFDKWGYCSSPPTLMSVPHASLWQQVVGGGCVTLCMWDQIGMACALGISCHCHAT